MTARKVVAGLFASLDGVVEAPETWHFPYLSPLKLTRSVAFAAGVLDLTYRPA